LQNSTIKPMEKRRKLPPKPANLAGPTALLTAVIWQAVDDYFKGDQTAGRYLAGPVYRQHLELLGLPTDWLPEGVQKDDIMSNYVSPFSQELTAVSDLAATMKPDKAINLLGRVADFLIDNANNGRITGDDLSQVVTDLGQLQQQLATIERGTK